MLKYLKIIFRILIHNKETEVLFYLLPKDITNLIKVNNL